MTRARAPLAEFDVEQRVHERPVTLSGAAIIPEPVRYEIGATPRVQRRFKGRALLTPLINLSYHTVRAVVDWVEIALQTDRETESSDVIDVLAAAVPN